MRIVFTTGSTDLARRPPRLAERVVHDLSSEGQSDCLVSLECERGAYDPGDFITRAGAACLPDVLLCHVDLTLQHRPINVKNVRCPRVLLVEAGARPGGCLTDLIAYVTAERFDRIVMLDSRHDARSLCAAGVRNVSWLPGLAFAATDAEVEAARRFTRFANIAYQPRTTEWPRASRLWRHILQACVPVYVPPNALSQRLAVFGECRSGLSIAVNGELGQDIFEILAASAALLTDFSAAERWSVAGWEESRDFIGFSSADELLRRARWLHENPTEAEEIGVNGARWFDRHLRFQSRVQMFTQLLDSGTVPAMYDLEEAPEAFVVGAPCRPEWSWKLLDVIRDLQGMLERVVVRAELPVVEVIRGLCDGMPRVQVECDGDGEGGGDLAVSGVAALPSVLKRSRRVYLHDLKAGEAIGIVSSFAEHGFGRIHPSLPLFGCEQAEVDAVCSTSTRALLALWNGAYDVAFEMAQQALGNDKKDRHAMVVMADLALETGKVDLAARVLASAGLAPSDDSHVSSLFAAASAGVRTWKLPSRLMASAKRWQALGEWQRSVTAARAALSADAEIADGYEVLGFGLVQMGAYDEAKKTLEEALRRNPENVSSRAALARVLRRCA